MREARRHPAAMSTCSSTSIQRRFSLLDLAAAQRFCQAALARPTDVLTRGARDPEVLIGMERGAVMVF